MSAHLMVAAFAECPELALTDDEAAQITRALDDVRSYYNVVLTEGQQVWGNVILTAGAVYGPKALAIYARKTKPRVKPSVVTPIKPPAEAAFAPRFVAEPEIPVA